MCENTLPRGERGVCPNCVNDSCCDFGSLADELLWVASVDRAVRVHEAAQKRETSPYVIPPGVARGR